MLQSVTADSHPLSRLDVLPDSRLRSKRGCVTIKGVNWEPVFCVNCGAPYGYVPETNITFTAWICRACEPKFGHLFDEYAIPDLLFAQRVREAMIEKYGRVLTALEQSEKINESGSILAKLARERKVA